VARRVVETLETQFTSDLRGLDRGFRDAEQKTNQFYGKMRDARGRFVSGAGAISSNSLLPGLANISNIIQGLPQIGNLASALISPLKDAAEEGVRFNMLVESAQVGFRGVTGGAKESVKYVKELTDFAAANPIFNTQGTIRAARMMSTFGFETRQTTGYLKEWGSALAAGGQMNDEALQGVVRAFGQMRSLGRVNAEEMNQLAERGIPSWELLAKAIGKTVAETRKLGERGQLKGGAAVDAITAMLKVDPRFAGQADAFAGTLEGRLAQLQDLQEVAQGRATEGLTGSLNRTLEAGMKGSVPDIVNWMAGNINSAITPVAGIIEASAKGLLGGGLTSGLSQGIAAGRGMVETAITDLANDSVIGLFGNLIKSHSPSQVFHNYGLDITQGLSNGFQDGARRATPSMVADAERIIEALRRAIIGQESGGDSSAVNPFSGATGMGQVMPANIPAWTREALGTSMSVEAFRKDPAAQNQTITFKLRQYFNEELEKAGGDAELAMRRVASRWYSGQGAWHTSTRPQKNNHPSISAYSTSVVNRARSFMSDDGASAGFGLGASAGDARGRVGIGLDAGAAFGAGVSVNAGRGIPVQVTNWEQANGLRNRDRREHGSFEPWVEVPKKESWYGEMFLGYDTDWSGGAQQGALSREQIVAGLREASANRLVETTGRINTHLSRQVTTLAQTADGFKSAEAAAGSFYDSVVGKDETTRFLGARVQDMATGFENAFATTFSNWEGGFKGVASRMVVTWAQSVADMVLQAQAARLTTALFGGFDEGGKSTGGGLLGGFLKILGIGAGAASGGGSSSFGGYSSGFYADGGSYPANRPRIVGEKGIELDIPHYPGAVVSNRDIRAALSGGGQSNARPEKSVVIHYAPVFHANPQTGKYDRQSATQSARMMLGMIQKEMDRGGA